MPAEIHVMREDLLPPKPPERRHLISIQDLSRDDVERLLATARSFERSLEREMKRLPTLRGRTVVNLFYESSTRTSSSFELAAKRLSADTMSIKAAGSSVDKGESLKDTALTMCASAMRETKCAAPTCGWRMTITSGSYAPSVSAVSFSDSPLSTDEPTDLIVKVSAESRFAASSKLEDVRVDDS